jgi:hypothetical protein
MQADMTATISNAERARRAEFVRDGRAACASGETFEKREQKREIKADAWSKWFRMKMDRGNLADPTELLPDAFAVWSRPRHKASAR